MKDDDKFAEQVAEAYLQSHTSGPRAMAAGGFLHRMADALKAIVAKAKEMGQPVPWGKIFALLGQVALILSTGGGDWASVLAAVLALFFPTPAPPVNVPGA